MTELRAAVVTVSDSVAAGTNEDRSGPLTVEILGGIGFSVDQPTVVPDGVESVERVLRDLAGSVHLIVTTGGTGLSPRDLTPEATAAVIDRPIPGIPEAMRAATFGSVPHGMLSRGIAGVVGTTVVVNLPGSSKAVREGLDVIGPVLVHAVEVATGDFGDHR